MRPSILPLCALQALAACGGRTEIAVGAPAHDAGLTQDVSAESGPLPPCHAGDPPRTLVTGIQTVQFNGMAADGEHLYIAQSIAPLLWSIPMLGGDTVALYGADFPNSVSTSTPTPLLTADGGIYFDALGDEGDGLTWVSGAGGKPKTIAPNYVSFFDWTQPRAFVWSGDIESGAFLTLSLDGALQPFLTIPPSMTRRDRSGARDTTLPSCRAHRCLVASHTPTAIDASISIQARCMTRCRWTPATVRSSWALRPSA